MNIGPGIQVMDIYYPEEESNILEITHKNNIKLTMDEYNNISHNITCVCKKTFKFNLKKNYFFLFKRDKEATFFKDQENMKLFATFRNKFEANQIKNLITPLFEFFQISVS